MQTENSNSDQSAMTSYKRWDCTVNNWTEADYNCAIVCGKFRVIGKEIGENGTPHLQCCFEFPSRKRLSTVSKLLPRGSWRPARNWPALVAYCKKGGDYVAELPVDPIADAKALCRQAYGVPVFKDWQGDIIDICHSEPDNRSIYWYHDRNGNVGKSWLAKYIYLYFEGVIIVSGCANDIFNQVRMMMEKEIPKIVICDIPRSKKGFISYQAIECLKNGLLYSGKYEGGTCVFPPVHVICFSNDEPDIENLSLDRWKIVSL